MIYTTPNTHHEPIRDCAVVEAGKTYHQMSYRRSGYCRGVDEPSMEIRCPFCDRWHEVPTRLLEFYREECKCGAVLRKFYALKEIKDEVVETKSSTRHEDEHDNEHQTDG